MSKKGHNFVKNFYVDWVSLLTVNPLPNNKILDMPKLKAFADDEINVTQVLKLF